MNLKPLGNKLLVEQLPERMPANGIVVPEAHKDSMTRGDTKVFRVLGVGRKVQDVHPGDIAICYSHTSGPIEAQDGKHIITDDQIIAVVPKL